MDNEKIDATDQSEQPKKAGRGSGLIPIKPGEVRGSRKGIQNKSTKMMKEALVIAAEASKHSNKKGLIGYLTWLADHREETFATLLGRLLPLQVNMRSEHVETKRYETVAEVRIAMIEKGIAPERADQLIALTMPRTTEDERKTERDN